MASLRFYKMATLPSTLQSNAFYLIQNGQYAEAYVTNLTGSPRAIGNSLMIGEIARNIVDEALSDLNALEIVADINERDELASSTNRNLVILVTDATGDPTVVSGAVMYAYNAATMTFTKLTEYDDVDAVIQWSNIQGRPTSSPAQLDLAVTLTHNHANKPTLDKISEDGEGLLFMGNPVQPRWSTNNW